MGPSGIFSHGYVILNCLGQVLYLGRAPRTKETLPDFREFGRVTRRSRVFHGLKGSQRTPGFWDVTLGSLSLGAIISHMFGLLAMVAHYLPILTGNPNSSY